MRNLSYEQCQIILYLSRVSANSSSCVAIVSLAALVKNQAVSSVAFMRIAVYLPCYVSFWTLHWFDCLFTVKRVGGLM